MHKRKMQTTSYSCRIHILDGLCCSNSTQERPQFSSTYCCSAATPSTMPSSNSSLAYNTAQEASGGVEPDVALCSKINYRFLVESNDQSPPGRHSYSAPHSTCVLACKHQAHKALRRHIHCPDIQGATRDQRRRI